MHILSLTYFDFSQVQNSNLDLDMKPKKVHREEEASVEKRDRSPGMATTTTLTALLRCSELHIVPYSTPWVCCLVFEIRTGTLGSESCDNYDWSI